MEREQQVMNWARFLFWLAIVCGGLGLAWIIAGPPIVKTQEPKSLPDNVWVSRVPVVPESQEFTCGPEIRDAVSMMAGQMWGRKKLNTVKQVAAVQRWANGRHPPCVENAWKDVLERYMQDAIRNRRLEEFLKAHPIVAPPENVEER